MIYHSARPGRASEDSTERAGSSEQSAALASASAAATMPLREEGRLPVANADIGEIIMGITDELPRPEDVAQVRAQLGRRGCHSPIRIRHHRILTP